MYFQYDTSGTPLGFIYNGTQYLYLTDQMGDVIAITDADGGIIAAYVYDAWGKLLNINYLDEENSEHNKIVNANPLRYRGYYYDNETGYYYLQSRYYDPSICRFINADIPEIANISKGVPVGTNSFAYCCNDPVNNVDYLGYTMLALIKVGTIAYNNSLAAQMYAWGFMNPVAYKLYNFSKFKIGNLLAKRLKSSTAVKNKIKFLIKKISNKKVNSSAVYKGILKVYSNSYTGYSNRDLMYATGDISNFYVKVKKVKIKNRIKYIVYIAIGGEKYSFDKWSSTKRNKFTLFMNNNIGYKSQKKGLFNPYVWYISFSYYW